MAGIFGGHIFEGEGLGQATKTDAAAEGGGATSSKGGSAYMPGGKDPSQVGQPAVYQQPTYMPPSQIDPAAYAYDPAAAGQSNTVLYVGLGVAALAAVVAVMAFGGGGRKVTANRGRRGRRSRRRSH